MGKLLFWVVVIVVGLLAARLLVRQAGKPSQQSPTHRSRVNSGASRHASAPANEALVRCTHCGIHLPRSQAVLMDGQIWCSQAHAHEHQQARRT